MYRRCVFYSTIYQCSLVKIYIDTVGPPATYQALLERLFPRIRITVAKKADSIYPIVSAASICAKVSRDAILKDWEFMEPGFDGSREFGCGYPSDGVTQKWLKDHLDPVFGFPRLIRFSWSTTANLLQEKGVKFTWPEEDSDLKDGQADMRSFFKNAGPVRDPIYTNLGLEPVTKL